LTADLEGETLERKEAELEEVRKQLAAAQQARCEERIQREHEVGSNQSTLH
jgi:hypothetical protein